MIITILSFKGGVGKSTTAIHLAGHLNERGPTAVSDGDANRSAMMWAQQGRLPFRVVDEAEALRVAGEISYLVMDTPARPDPIRLPGLIRAADLVLLVVEPDVFSLATLRPTLKALEEQNARHLLMFNKVRYPAEVLAARGALEGAPVVFCDHYVRQYIAARKAGTDGVLCRDVDDPHGLDLWNDFGEIAQEVLNVGQQG